MSGLKRLFQTIPFITLKTAKTTKRSKSVISKPTFWTDWRHLDFTTTVHTKMYKYNTTYLNSTYWNAYVMIGWRGWCLPYTSIARRKYSYAKIMIILAMLMFFQIKSSAYAWFGSQNLAVVIFCYFRQRREHAECAEKDTAEQNKKVMRCWFNLLGLSLLPKQNTYKYLMKLSRFIFLKRQSLSNQFKFWWIIKRFCTEIW